MSFYGSAFSFDGKSCEDFGLMMYDFNNTNNSDSEYAPGIEIVEDRLSRRPRSLFYGTAFREPLRFTLVFGVGLYSDYQQNPIDRPLMEVVGKWLLTGDSYKWLTIDQPDMEEYRYRCVITDLKTIEYAGDKWAFSCQVNCDSPFGYKYPKTFTYSVNGTSNVSLRSESTTNQKYYPKVVITVNSGTEVSITNNSDAGWVSKFTGLPSGARTITLDGERGVVIDSAGLNLYPYFNFQFPRLCDGLNNITIKGNCNVSFECEFPVNIGG